MFTNKTFAIHQKIKGNLSKDKDKGNLPKDKDKGNLSKDKNEDNLPTKAWLSGGTATAWVAMAAAGLRAGSVTAKETPCESESVKVKV